MNDIGEAVGSLAEGTLIARAVEPAHGEADAGHTHERACLNCGTALVGSHCHACGQAAHVHRTLGAFFHDLLHGVFHFEGKIWRTLPMLAWHPGRLTREYIDGRRASYVSPIALFLFVVFVTFALFNLVVPPTHIGGSDSMFTSATAKTEAATSDKIVRLERDLAAAKAGGESTDRIELRLAEAHDELEGIRAVAQGKLPDTIAKDSDPAARGFVQAVNTAWSKVGSNPDLAIYKLQSSTYKYSWLLIPLSVPFVWLLFPFSRRFHVYDHTVFVTYSLSFMLILLAAGAAISVWSAADGLLVALLLYAPFHMYRQLRGTYGIGRFGAIWRAWLLMGFAMMALGLFAAAILGLSLG